MTKRWYRKSKWKVFRARLQIKWCIVFQCNWFAKYSLSNSRLTFIISPWISISFPSKIPDPDRQISEISDPEKPTDDPSLERGLGGGGGGGVDSYMKGAEMMVGTFELNP